MFYLRIIYYTKRKRYMAEEKKEERVKEFKETNR